MLACLGARDFGIDVPAELFNEVDAWFLSLTDKKSGRSGYEVPGTLPVRSAEALQSFPPGKSESLTAISLFCRLMLGHRAQKEPLLHTQARLIDKKLPRWDEDGGSIDMYYWYYGSLAQRQMGEPYWSKWYAALSKVLLAAQRRDGNSTGSFDPVGAWGKDGGRIYSTCMSLLSLQAAYRYEVLAELTPFPSGPLYRSVRKHWREERYDRVHAFLRKQRAGSLSTGQDKRLHKAERALQERIDEATAYVAAISPRTRFFAAKKRLEGIKKDFGSLEAGKAAKAQLELFRRDKAIARELKAGEELEKLRKNFATAKPRQLAKLESAVEKLLTKYKNSQVSAETKALLREIAAAIKKN